MHGDCGADGFCALSVLPRLEQSPAVLAKESGLAPGGINVSECNNTADTALCESLVNNPLAGSSSEPISLISCVERGALPRPATEHKFTNQDF